jgi:hypothetical protein
MLASIVAELVTPASSAGTTRPGQLVKEERQRNRLLANSWIEPGRKPYASVDWFARTAEQEDNAD